MLAVRFFNVFGPLQPAGHAYAAVVPAFVDAALDGRPLPVHGDGSQSRDFTYVGSVCRVLEEAVRRRAAHDGPVNLAFGTRITLLEVIAAIEAELGHAVRARAPAHAGGRRAALAGRHHAAARPVPRRRAGAVRGRAASDDRLVPSAAGLTALRAERLVPGPRPPRRRRRRRG